MDTVITSLPQKHCNLPASHYRRRYYQVDPLVTTYDCIHSQLQNVTNETF